MKWGEKTVIVILVALLPLFVVAKAIGQTSSSINESVKISICGNGIIENGEDCEGINLNNMTCQSLGYSGGTLSCDISCSFDTSQCIAPTPTPTPTSTPTPEPTTSIINSSTVPTSQPNTNSTQNPQIFYPTQETITPTSNQFSFFPFTNTPSLPSALKYFDLDGTGKINPAELHEIITLWVNSWKQYLTESIEHTSQKNNLACDINHNGSCNLDDFSILLYYVGR